MLVAWARSTETRAIDTLVGAEERAISVVTVSELLHGVHRATGARRNTRSAFVEHVLAAFEPIPITEPVARAHAQVWADLEGRGAVIGAHDLWIAATALAHGLGVVTHDRADFERIDGLRVIVPPGRDSAARTRA